MMPTVSEQQGKLLKDALKRKSVFDELQKRRAAAGSQLSEREMALIASSMEAWERLMGDWVPVSERVDAVPGGYWTPVDQRVGPGWDAYYRNPMAHGGRVARSIDGKATKGLTRGSRRT